MALPAPHPPAAPTPLTDRQHQALLRLCAVLRAIADRYAAGLARQTPGLTSPGPTSAPMLPPEASAPAVGTPGPVEPA